MDCSVLSAQAFILRWKRVCIAHNNCMSCPSIWATLSALLINILLGSFQLFLHGDQPLSEGEIIPFSGVCQSGGGCIIAETAWWLRTDWQTVMCNRRRPAATSSRRASFPALASANSRRVFCIERSNIMTHLHVSNCRVRNFQFSGIFVALGFVGNGVITVMVNSPWQADDDADSRAGEIIASDSAHTSISLTVPPASLRILQSGCQPYARTDHNQRPAVKPDIAATVDCLTDITAINRQSKAPRSLICCNATASWLSENLPGWSCLRLRHPTNRKSWVASNACCSVLG